MHALSRGAKTPAPVLLALLLGGGIRPAFAAVSYFESATASAATGSGSSTAQYFNPVYDPSYAGDGPGGLPAMLDAGLHYDILTPSNIVSATPPAGLSASASPATYTENVPIYIGTASGFTILPTLANAHAFASVSISGNSMHGFAQATGSITPVSFTYVEDGGDTQIVYNPLAAKSYAKAIATLTDRVTITSATVPVGTPVDIQVVGTVHAQVTDPETSIFNSYFTLASLTGQVGPVNLYVGATADPSIVPATQTTVFHSTVGASFNISESFAVQVLGIASHYRLGSVDIYDNEVQASNTSILNLFALTTGVSFSSEAGIDYAAVAVPEPSSLGVLGICLGLLLRARRQRVSHK